MQPRKLQVGHGARAEEQLPTCHLAVQLLVRAHARHVAFSGCVSAWVRGCTVVHSTGSVVLTRCWYQHLQIEVLTHVPHLANGGVNAKWVNTG